MRKLAKEESGGVLIMVGVILVPLLLIAIGVVVDVGRYYAVQVKAQNASDAALLGAVATLSTNPGDPEDDELTRLTNEVRRLFAANYPTGYMGSEVQTIVVTPTGDGFYEVSFIVSVPPVVMQLFGHGDADINILSQVTGGWSNVPRRLELALVLDNTGSMSVGGKIQDLRDAARDLVGIVFGDAETLDNVHVSLVPYDVAVNIGAGRVSWVQAAHHADYLSQAASNRGFVSNRNHDSPPNMLVDASNAPPLTEETRFRTPFGGTFASCIDNESILLSPMRFALNSKATLFTAIDAMNAAGCTRINVGLMWGWFTLSSSWQGVWDAGRPGLPAAPDGQTDKAMVLMTDGLNTVFTGAGGTSNDNTTTAQLCQAVKAQGIKLYTVGFGEAAAINETLLQNCASQPSYYFHAPTSEQLRTVFHQIADDIVFNTIRLSQ